MVMFNYNPIDYSYINFVYSRLSVKNLLSLEHTLQEQPARQKLLSYFYYRFLSGER